MKKRVIGFLLILCMIFSMAIVPVHADWGACGENLQWYLNSGALTISGTGNMTNWIYSDVRWHGLTSSIKTVIIQNGVTSIGDYAFSDCENLVKIIIPNSVTNIGSNAFSNCHSLASVTIPDSVTSIGSSAFYYCAILESITIPDSVASIGDGAFRYCKSLNDVTIGFGVTNIERSLFSYCNLTSINVSEQNQYYSSDNGVLFNKNKTTLIICPIGKTGTYKIPDSVISVGDYAFSKCAELTEITIPERVTNIGEGAFNSCGNLRTITIPERVISIGSSAFKNCVNLENIIIPESVISIGDSAFDNCSSLESITIPESVTSLESYLFSHCSSLTSITIPKNATKIGSGAFYYCIGLESVSIPSSVTSIGKWAFDYCSRLTDVYYNGTPSQWNSISMGVNNEYLANATRHHIQSIDVVQSGQRFTVTTKNINAGNSIIFAVYKDGKMVDMQTEVYDGTDGVFSVTVPYDTVKAMAWENLTSMEPLCPLKIISQ